jgi:hypothetical protein
LLSNSRLVEGLPLDRLRGSRPDVAIVDGNYGTARYGRRRTQENEIADQVSYWLGRSATVILPVPRLGLGQELLAMLRAHHHFTGRNLDIWVDRDVATVCDVYLEFLDTFPQSVQNFARNQPLFWDERVRPRVRRLDQLDQLDQLTPTEKQAEKLELLEPATKSEPFGNVVPSLNPFNPFNPFDRLEPSNSIKSGEISGTLLLIDDRSDFDPYLRVIANPVFLFPHQPDRPAPRLPDRIPRDTYQLSEHCDSAGTTQLIHNLRPQHLILVGRSPSYLADLSNLPELYDRYQVHCPVTHRHIVLPLRSNATALESLPITRYEGEVSEQRNQAMIQLPSDIQADPRWQRLADTGLVELRWQGEDLLVRGLAASEVLEAGRGSIAFDVECCANCVHCRGQQCRNSESPLVGRRVSPEGCCPVFEAVESEF